MSAITLLAEFLAKSDELDASAELIRTGRMTNEEIYNFTDAVKEWNADFIKRVRAEVSRDAGAVSNDPADTLAIRKNAANRIIDFAYRVRYGELKAGEEIFVGNPPDNSIRAVIISD